MESASTKPPLSQRATSGTVVERKRQASVDSAGSTDKRPIDDNADGGRDNASRELESQPAAGEPVPPLTGANYHASYIVPVVVTLIMFLWPWILFGAVRTHHGVAANPHFSGVVRRNPQTVIFFVTHLGTLFAGISALLFSTAIVRFSQKWIMNRDEVEVFHISFFTTLRHQRFPWGVKDLTMLARKWYLIVVVLSCILTFNFVPSSISALLGPIPFNKTASLTGKELDFTSTAPDCVTWLKTPRIQDSCNWFSYHGLEYTSCLGQNQLVDALESGRGNIFALLSNNTQSQVFSQLGGRDGLRFLGPVRGVLPLGPNGVPAFNTLDPSPLSNPHALAGIYAYRYTLNLQGLSSKISCAYTASSIINFVIPPGTAGIYQAVGVCPTGQEVLPTTTKYLSIFSDHTLGFWVCGQGSRNADGAFDSYYLYLRGYRLYNDNIGNITCTLSPVQPAVFPVTFSTRSTVFTSQQPVSLSTNSPSDLITLSILGLGSLVSDGQGFSANAIAESVITFGVKSFALSPFAQNDTYLRLFEAMLQGMIEYQATYVRLVYTANGTAPPSCTRTVSGSVNYEVTGWFYDGKTVGFLLPTTFINLASLILLLIAMYMGEKVLYSTDPTDPKSLLLAPTELRREGTKVKIELEGGGVTSFWADMWTVIKGAFIGTATDAGVQIGEATAQHAVGEVAEKAGFADNEKNAQDVQSK